MIKRTLYFGNPAYLSLNNSQLIVRLPEKNNAVTEALKQQVKASIPVEDIGVMILDNKQITLTHALLAELLNNNVAVITSDDSHLPNGLFMPLAGNTVQTEKFKAQIEASLPLKKQLWQLTITAKILNQATVLKQHAIEHQNMLYWASSVKSGDTENHEARASAYYWSALSPILQPEEKKGITFKRHRNGDPPNNLLNYGYAILRAITARALVSSGLLPTLGIFHRNKYNAYCLADDIMEPYRPWVDRLVIDFLKTGVRTEELDTEVKKHLLSIATQDVIIEESRSPLMVAVSRTTASLARCFEGSQRKIVWPSFAD